MTSDHKDLLRAYDLIDRIFSAVANDIDDRNRKFVIDDINAGEPELALNLISACMVKDRKPVEAGTFELMKELAYLLGKENDEWVMKLLARGPNVQ